MRTHFACLLALFLSGCGLTPQGDAFQATLVTKGAALADSALENAEWAICNAASVGSVMRRYGQDVVLAEAYSTLCLPSREAVRELLAGEGKE